MAGRLVVIGSINVDLVVTAERLPRPGETVLGGRFTRHFGGKGANQAVAAARAGADVAFVGAVGNDEYGEASLQALAAEGIDVGGVRRAEAPTGVALIAVGAHGENQIVVAPGANGQVEAARAREAVAALPSGSVVLASLEVPLDTVVAGLTAAHAAGLTPVLNPAPAHALPIELLEASPILTPNEHELTVAIGNNDPAAALTELTARLAAPVIVTQGAAGALLAHRERRRRFPAPHPAAVVDTTGAGDTFSGVLAAFLAEGRSLDEAIHAANVAASMSVSVAGAREGMPHRPALDDAIRAAG